jgi:hypothetical protein
MRALPRALEIIFEVQKKRSNEKIARKKKSFSIYKMHLIYLFLFYTPPIFKPSNFLIYCSFKKI